jgi:hypothetical protein
MYCLSGIFATHTFVSMFFIPPFLMSCHHFPGGGGWDADETTAPVARSPEELQEDRDREEFWMRVPWPLMR